MQIATIGKRIRALREAKKWSCRELARQADVSANTVLNAEAGRSISTATLARLAEALGVEVVTFVLED